MLIVVVVVVVVVVLSTCGNLFVIVGGGELENPIFVIFGKLKGAKLTLSQMV